MPSTRRNVLRATPVLLLSGCSGIDSSPSRPPTSELPPSTPPTTEVPRVESYPFTFDGTVEATDGGTRGWFFDGTFTKHATVSGSVTHGEPVSVAVTEENVERARWPESIVSGDVDVSELDIEAEVTDGNGSVLLDCGQETTLELTVEVTTI
ncbi:hypothetical protein [Haloarchaeobius iranensis]|uniref:Uncharacterized protein n=1 Tax=Haloarchaeobius iranensis TaxID=996166 RepID=A0A1G9UZH1_9EURY|nr:hypothetical protein [Haloarchaeobius iranensis]SDM65344.1 hypothetical protein SAMN05192554_10599 [Haloarchaeobius iranensis]